MQKRGVNQGLLSNRDSPRQQKIFHVMVVMTDPEVYACGRRTKACVRKTSRDEKSWGEGNGLLRHVWLLKGCCVFVGCHKDYRSKNGEGEVSFTIVVYLRFELAAKSISWFAEREGLMFKVNKIQ